MKRAVDACSEADPRGGGSALGGREPAPRVEQGCSLKTETSLRSGLVGAGAAPPILQLLPGRGELPLHLGEQLPRCERALPRSFSSSPTTSEHSPVVIEHSPALFCLPPLRAVIPPLRAAFPRLFLAPTYRRGILEAPVASGSRMPSRSASVGAMS